MVVSMINTSLNLSAPRDPLHFPECKNVDIITTEGKIHTGSNILL